MDYKGLLLQLKEHRNEQEIGSYKYMSNSVIYIKYPSLNIIIVTVMVEDNNTFKLVKKGTVYISKNMPKEIREEIIKEINIGIDKYMKRKRNKATFLLSVTKWLRGNL